MHLLENGLIPPFTAPADIEDDAPGNIANYQDARDTPRGTLLGNARLDQHVGERGGHGGGNLGTAVGERDRVRVQRSGGVPVPHELLQRLDIGAAPHAADSFPDGESALMFACARIRYITANEWSTRRYLDMSRFDDTLQAAN